MIRNKRGHDLIQIGSIAGENESNPCALESEFILIFSSFGFALCRMKCMAAHD